MTTIQKRKQARPLLLEPGFFAVAAMTLTVIGFSAAGFCFPFMGDLAAFFLTVQVLVGALWATFSRPPWYLAGQSLRNFPLKRLRVVAWCAAILLSVPLTHWPVRLTVALSESALDDIADRVEQGEKLRYPVRAGLFVIQSAEVSDLSNVGALPKSPVLRIHRSVTSCQGFVRGSISDGMYGCFSVAHRSERWLQFFEE